MPSIDTPPPAIRLVTDPVGPYIEVWHLPQPERYRVTDQTWKERPDHLPVRHVHAAQPVDTSS